MCSILATVKDGKMGVQSLFFPVCCKIGQKSTAQQPVFHCGLQKYFYYIKSVSLGMTGQRAPERAEHLVTGPYGKTTHTCYCIKAMLKQKAASLNHCLSQAIMKTLWMGNLREKETFQPRNKSPLLTTPF